MPQLSKNKQNFLVEIHTEELPPKTLQRLAESLRAEIAERLDKAELAYHSTHYFATPRRLAVLVTRLAGQQKDTLVERRGPAWTAAFDQAGQPTSACLGFARSCGVTPEQLIHLENEQGSWVSYQQKIVGKSVIELMPVLIQQALAALPIAKRMRWGNSTVEFVRPVHSVIMLYGKQIIDADILGCRTGRLTRGHRFHSKAWITITSPANYAKNLAKKYVIADFAQRKTLIRAAVEQAMPAHPGAHVIIEEHLLDEVTGLVEWPVALCGHFDPAFLSVPPQALIAAMQDHQRYFPIVDQDGQLLPYFITVANINSHDPCRVIAGNERVLRARLADAAFFFTTDKKRKLNDRLLDLKHIVFQTKLGTLFDKAQRVATLAKYIGSALALDVQLAERAGWLSKTDLSTAMVSEFPELQGIMGYYYALADGENPAVASALKESYLPRFSGDHLPATPLGAVLAIAERIDTLVGIFGINQIPTGEKDPFGLRRAALGVLRILIEQKLDLNLYELIAFASQSYEGLLENPHVILQVTGFMLERLKPWYQDQGIAPDVFASVAALNIFKPYDIHLRIQAVQHFKTLPEAAALSIANKRVNNLWAKSATQMTSQRIQKHLFEEDAEHTLAQLLLEKSEAVKTLNYTEVLVTLASLRKPVDDFFTDVMVMTEDQPRRENRLLMLKQLRELFLHVADIALLDI